MSRLLSTDQESPKLEFKKSHDNKDFFSLAADDQVIIAPAKRRNSTVTLVKELLNLTLQEKKEIVSKEKQDIKSLVIELEQDDEFFKMLMQELSQAAMLQDVTTQKFEHDISDLEGRMTKVVNRKKMFA